MLATFGLGPVAQLLARSSPSVPVELKPVAPEWPITAMASSLGVRATGEVADGVAEADNDAPVAADELLDLEVFGVEPSFESQADMVKTAAIAKASRRIFTGCR